MKIIINLFYAGTSFPIDVNDTGNYPRGTKQRDAFIEGELISYLYSRRLNFDYDLGINGVAVLNENLSSDSGAVGYSSSNKLTEKFKQATGVGIDETINMGFEHILKIIKDNRNIRTLQINIYGFSRGAIAGQRLIHEVLHKIIKRNEFGGISFIFNIFAIDPVPGPLFKQSVDYRLPEYPYITYIAAYAIDERNVGFDAIIPIQSHHSQSVCVFGVPGAHETLVGSNCSDLLKTPISTHLDKLNPSSLYIKKIASLFQMLWNNARCNESDLDNLQQVAHELQNNFAYKPLHNAIFPGLVKDRSLTRKLMGKKGARGTYYGQQHTSLDDDLSKYIFFHEFSNPFVTIRKLKDLIRDFVSQPLF